MEFADFKSIVIEYTREIGENMNCIFSPISESFKLTKMQTIILMELNQCESHTIGSLAESICAAGTNISAMCKKLEGQGLVERIRNRKDERVVGVILTKSGKDTVIKIERLISDKLFQQLETEKKEDFEDIILGLRKLNELLQRIKGNKGQ